MASSIIWNIKGFGLPYITVKEHFKEGEEIQVGDDVYVVDKCDPINREDQLQNVYVKPKS